MNKQALLTIVGVVILVAAAYFLGTAVRQLSSEEQPCVSNNATQTVATPSATAVTASPSATSVPTVFQGQPAQRQNTVPTVAR